MKINNAPFDAIGIGSALLDFTVEVKDTDLVTFGLKKGEMQLIDADRSKEILSHLEGYRMQTTPGGSSANTLAGIANFGGKGAFCGRVGKDKHGDVYIADTEKTGVKAKLGRGDGITGHAITFITPDSERSFATHLGAAINLNKNDIHADDIKDSKILHLEGYLFEPPTLREACLHAMDIAKQNGVLISVDLSDPGLIGRIHSVFQNILKSYVNIVFVNEEEAKAFTGKEALDALHQLYTLCDFAVVKLGAKGSLIKYEDTVHTISAYKTNLVNTNGAGDIYAAGVLYGIANKLSPEMCGKCGSYASSLVVAQVGARYNGKISLNAVK